MSSNSANWRALTPACLLAILGLSAIGLASVWPHQAAATNQPLAVFAWNRDAMGVVIDAGARIISPGQVPGSLIVIADHPDILQRLYRAGAVLVLRADDTIGCTPRNITQDKPGKPL